MELAFIRGLSKFATHALLSKRLSKCIGIKILKTLKQKSLPVDAHIGGAGEPGVEDVDAAGGVGSPDALFRGIVMEPQPLVEPVHGGHPHARPDVRQGVRGSGCS
ncbi:hypothetical protein H920_06616 [Fukomys damarensis]|uniref:Uncharacterized protein n=1 Tax=Fukomys damarensis TaxID=885580 RepID=A0A091DLR4_FUKDA|nr:hypothetical protein H920_06616 [Fukomys damarensis]